MKPAKLNKMLAQAQKMQAKIQEDIAAMRVERASGGGLVKATVDGNKHLVALEISKDALEDAEPDEVADLVMAAINAAQEAADEEAQAKMGELAGGLGLPPGMGF